MTGIIEFFQNLSATELFATGSLGGSLIAAVAAIICAMINKNSSTSISKKSDATIGAIGTLSDTLLNSKATFDEVFAISTAIGVKLDDMLQIFKAGQENTRETNMAIAAFVLECFNQSNLSDDKKAKLQLLYDQMFYTDKTDLVTKLHADKTAAENAYAEQVEKNKQLENELADIRAQLANAKPTKRTRRI